MENRLLTRDRMDRMIDAADDGEARKVLAECGYPEGGSLDQALAAARADVFRDMESAVPDRRLVEIFQLKYDYHNAKTLLKAAAMGRDPQPLLLPLVFVLCMVGAYGTNNRIFDCWALIFLGLVGYLLRKGNFPTTPLILGFVLGSIMELNFRRALSYSNGNYMEFITHPISGVFLAIALFSLIFNLYTHHKRVQSKKTA